MLASLSLVALFLSAQGGLLARVVFEVRQEAIATHHCENRFDPHSTCKGFCFLKKHLNEHDKQEHERTLSVPVSTVFFYLPGSRAHFAPPAPRIRHMPETGSSIAASGFSATIEHPPRVA